MKVTIECDSIEQAVNIFKLYYGELPAVQTTEPVVKVPGPNKVKGQRGRPPGSKNARPTAPVAEAQSETTTAATTASARSEPVTAPALTVADARTKLQELNAKKGMAACQKVMNALNVPRVSELKPAEIVAFIAAVDAEINA